METGQEKARYSRADLLALRYEGNARQRPICSNQTELQTLGFWKNGVLSVGSGGSGCGISSSSYGNSCLSPETDNSSLSSSNNGLNSSRRALRNRERANNYYQRFAPNDSQLGCEDRERDRERDRDRERERDTQSSNNIIAPSFKSSSIDHRSISISDLMPAFAKRRFAAAAESSELTTNNANSDDFISGVERNGTPTLLNKESKRNYTVLNVPNGRGGCDNEHSLASSPTYSSARHERRIGSGRLLPRNDNWEFKKQETDTDSAVVEREKDRERPHNGSMLQNTNQQSQRTYSGRQNDREFCGDRDQRRSQYEGKRPLDRPTGVGTTTGSGAVGGLNCRRASNKDKFSFIDVGRGKRGSGGYHQMQDRHHKEPEWFSAGPTSQLETIDLHGFDDLENSNESRTSDSQKDRACNALPIDTDTQINQETMSKNSSSGSLNLLETKVGDDIKDIDMNTLETGNFTLSQQESDQLIKPQHSSNPEVEFNFDAFLNLDPLDNSLIGNDADIPGAEISGFGKSRFSRWFGPNESSKTNNNDESPKIRETNTPDMHGIPSVKDLEAQMTKVDLHTAMAMPPQSVSHVEKPVARDTEAFKKLLQQLGAQNTQQGHDQEAATDLFQMMRVPNAISRNTHQLSHPHLIDAQQNFGVRTDEDVQPFLQQQQQQRSKVSECLPPHRIVEAPQQPNSVHGPSPNIHLQTQKRMEIQHLIQSIFRGDISLEFLEKELINPNTTAHTKEVIGAVFRECSNARRNSMPPKQTYQNDVIGGHQNLNAALPSYHQTLGPNISEELFTPNLPSNPTMNHHIRHSNSPTPLAFTPTSVLRKMTADKDTPPLHNSPGNQQQQKHQQYHQYQAQVTKPIAGHHMLMESQQMPAINLQPRMILGGGGTYAPNLNSPQVSPKLLPHPRNQQQPQPQQIKWPTSNIQAPHTIKSFGRPILKGTLNSAPVQQAPQPVAPFASKIELQRLSEGISQIQQHHQFVQQAQSRQSARQPRQMAHMDMHRQHNQPGPTDSPECVNVLQNNGLGAINYHRDDRLSSTTNQLAQWFSPELLAKASAGKLPLLNMNQALSLEEFERRIQHSSATVHN